MKKMKSVARRMTLIALGYVIQFIIVVVIAAIRVDQVIPKIWKGVIGTILFVYALLVHHVGTGYFKSLYNGYTMHIFIVSTIIILSIVFTSRSVKDMMKNHDIKLQ